jgi:hypothetical protein
VIQKADPTCDPTSGPCTVQIRIPLEFPGHEQNLAITSGAPKPIVYYFEATTPPACTPSFPFNDCGALAICGQIGGPQFLSDAGETLIRRGGVTCDNVESIADVLSLSVFTCLTSSICRKRLDVSDLAFGGEAVGEALGCPVPPPVQSCRRDGGTGCRDCPAGGIGVNGSGPSLDGSAFPGDLSPAGLGHIEG